MSPPPQRIVIVGAGIAGLSIGWTIKQRSPNVDLVVLERGARAGGNIQTEHIDGYTCESGPDGFLDTAPATLALVHGLGLDAKLLRSNDAARRRYIFCRGRLHQVPTSIREFVTTPLLSVRGKLRIIVEPFATARSDEDESILDFATRRIGSEAATAFIDPMVSGIFAGDAAALSLKSCFPKMRQIEDEHGGLMRGLLATRRLRKKREVPGAPAGRLTSFTGGMSDLIDGLTGALRRSIHLETPVTAIACNQMPLLSREGSVRPTYTIKTARGTLSADALILSNPAAECAAMVREFDPTLSAAIAEIPTAPLAVVCLGYVEDEIRSQCDLDGFGFLVPRGEGISILGTLWETSIYRHRAPSGRVLLRVMIGGARNAGVVSLADAQLLSIVRDDLRRTMRVSATPEFVRVIRHYRGIPQYVRGHHARMQRIDALLGRHPGLFVAGNSFRGASVNACIAEAAAVADAALAVQTTRPTVRHAESVSSRSAPCGFRL